MESLADIHDPGLTPGGLANVKEFYKVYPFLRAPQIIITSHLRRCLQTALRIRETLPNSGNSIRIVAHPDLQEVSIQLCDTGSPLDVLREEYPSIDFPDELFPVDYPRLRHVKPVKKNTPYDNEPPLLDVRAKRFREYLSESVQEQEIIIITHGKFVHYLFNCWSGEPGRSHSGCIPLDYGRALPCIIPDVPSPELELNPFMDYFGPWYLAEGDIIDRDPNVYAYGQRDCGIFTDDEVRNAVDLPLTENEIAYRLSSALIA